MATPNSKKKRINDKSNDATAIAWAEPRNRPIQKARRVQVWLKNSVTTLTSPTAVEFDQNQRGSPRQRRRQRQRQSSPQRRPTSTTTSRKTTATIDQAMFSLYTYTGPKKKLQGTSMVPVEPETPSSYVPNYDYDWFLDGRADWKEENTTSCEYLKFLNDPWDMESYIGKYLQEREEKIQKEMQEEEEAFQFEAKFEEAAAESNHLDATIGDEEEEFGEFQEPSTSSVNETPGMGEDTEKQNHDDDDDFGDFQEATDVHQYIPSSSLDPQAELEIDNSLNTNPSEKETPQAPKEEISSDNNNNNDDDVNNDLVENKEETEHKAPIPELSQEKNNADDISSLGCYNSVDVDDDEGSDEEDDHHSTGKKSCPAALESTTEEQLPPMEISCNSNNTMPIMSPGSIGDSIFACSYQNEELESTEEELVAEAVQILATVRSTGDDDDDDEHEQMPFVEEACETTKQPQNEAENSSYSSTVDEAAGLSGEQDICTKTKTNISDEAGSSSSVPKDADIDKTTDADTTNKAAEAIPADCARGSNATVQVSSKLQTHTASEDASASSRKSSEDSIQTLGEDNLETTAETGEANDCTEEDEVDYFGDFYEAPLVHHESPIEQDHSDDDFGDFIDVPTDKIADDQLWVLQAGATTVDHTNTSDVEHRAEVFHSTADTGVAGFSEALSSFTPTFAVLPPLPGAPCSSDSNLSDSYTESQTSQQRAEQSQDIIFNAEQQNATAANVLDDYEIFSVGSNASTTSKCPISWRLTIEDLSTLEARFARRQWQKHNRQLKASHGSSVSFAESDYGSEFGQEQATPIDELEIPQYYFTQPDLDDTVRVLQNAPWHHIAHLWDDSQEDEDVSNLRIASSYSFEDQLDRRAVWEEYLTDELCHLDAAQNEVSKHLLKRIRPHEPTLKVANRSIHEFATNLHLAQMYLKRSQAAIRQAAKGTYDNERNLFQSNAGWHGAHDLLQAWDQQELYGRFQKTLDEIQDILDTEKLLLDRVENYAFSKENPREYEVLLRRVNKLKTLVLSHDAWRRLDALAYLRSRLTKNSLLSTFYNRLHILAGSMAVRCCRRRQNAVQEEYSTLLEAVMHVWDTLGNACELPGVEEEKKNLHLQLSATWPDTILQALCYEADRAMAASLLDPLIDTDNLEATVESEYEKELTQLAYELQQDWGDVAKLRTVTHNLVIIRFDWEDSNRYLLSVYHRLCLLLTDVLYAHYTFGLWHEQIVNKYESDCTGSEDSKEEKSETVDEQSTNKRSCSSKRLALLEKIRAKWLENREVIWKRCEAVLMKCLDEYVHFASHKSQKTTHQKRSSAVIDETISSNHSNASQNTEEDLWRNDLEDLHSILILTEQFMSMRDRLFGSTSVRCEYTKITGELKEKLCDVFRKNLRHIHVDAMKSLGMSLSQENWGLHSCKGLSGYEQTASMSIQELLSRYLSKASDTSAGLSKLKGNATPDSRSLFIKQHDVVVANPFLETSSVVDSHESRNNSPGQRRVDEQFTCDVYKMIDEVMADGNTANSFTRVASDSTLKVLFPWVARLLVVMEKLPVIVEDISAVFANLCDLYFTTVFRICAGNATNERLLLGIEMPAQPSLDFDSRETMSLPEKGKPSSSPSLFGFRRRSSSGSIASSRRKSSLPKVEIPTCLDGDICSPHPSEVSGLEYTRAFVQRAQKSLQDIVMLDKVDQWITDPTIVGAKPGENEKIVAQAIRNLELRLGAAYSCLMISTVLDVTCKVATDKLSKSALGRQFIEDLSTLEHYAKAVFQMVPKLVRICSKVSCVRAILAKRVVLEILKVGSGWEEAKLNEHPSDYIEALCKRCACIWGGLTASKKKLPAGMLRSSWEDMISGGFLSLLEGFSKVPFCSTEGRALMSMDLASFAAGVNPTAVLEHLDFDEKCYAPPIVEPRHGMSYVDTYIKVFYYPEEDVMQWIRQNYQRYHLNHCLKLASNAFLTADASNGITADVALEAVKNIYHQENSSTLDEADTH